MFVYWLLYAIPAFFALNAPVKNQRQHFNMMWVLFLLLLITIIGFRYQVGGDWLNYMQHLYILKNTQLQDLSFRKEAGYLTLIWLGTHWGGIYCFNVFAATVFSLGLIRFCLQLTRPWLALTIAIPYMVIVVAMGYTRQSIALGTMMFGLCSLQKRQTKNFVLWLGVGYLFHQTSLLLMPLVFWFKKQSMKGENLLILMAMFPFIYEIYHLGISIYSKNYIEAHYNSAGALIRLSLNCVPGLLYLLFKERFVLLNQIQHKICQVFSICSVTFMFFYFISPSSTALDRFSLYLQPLQLVVWSSIPDVFGTKNSPNRLLVLLVVMIYAGIEFFWLFFSLYSNTWLPYRFYWWEVLTDKIWMFNPLTQLI